MEYDGGGGGGGGGGGSSTSGAREEFQDSPPGPHVIPGNPQSIEAYRAWCRQEQMLMIELAGQDMCKFLILINILVVQIIDKYFKIQLKI